MLCGRMQAGCGQTLNGRLDVTMILGSVCGEEEESSLTVADWWLFVYHDTDNDRGKSDEEHRHDDDGYSHTTLLTKGRR